ncbi:hypothetical protein KL86DPRO_30089 [uncultured delta proteobacterium]|uniref:Uncharacterized protein n=1 Tax=uncultured delta proteobacterium TaxID=34034 RepID=A0A212K7J6_9DELT|nr:hypothetical protein KL86DPRO_30089 [uncultured delta proteobacterium]
MYLFISTVRKKMSFLFSGIAGKIGTITPGEEMAPGDMVLDIDERLTSEPSSLYICAEKLLRSERFSHLFSERALDRFITTCALPENKETHPQVYVECDTPFTGNIPGVMESNDPFARYFRKAVSGRPHVYYHWLQEKKDFSRIFFKKEELLHFMGQSITVKKAFYLYLVRNAELLRGTGKEMFSRSSLEKLHALLPQYPKSEKQGKDLRALIAALEGKSNEDIAGELGISEPNDVNKRFKPAMDLAFQHDIFQLEWLLLARERGRRKKRR